jgi:hypothetical protein
MTPETDTFPEATMFVVFILLFAAAVIEALPEPPSNIRVMLSP